MKNQRCHPKIIVPHHWLVLADSIANQSYVTTGWYIPLWFAVPPTPLWRPRPINTALCRPRPINTLRANFNPGPSYSAHSLVLPCSSSLHGHFGIPEQRFHHFLSAWMYFENYSIWMQGREDLYYIHGSLLHSLPVSRISFLFCFVLFKFIHITELYIDKVCRTVTLSSLQFFKHG